MFRIELAFVVIYGIHQQNTISIGINCTLFYDKQPNAIGWESAMESNADDTYFIGLTANICT